MRLARRLRDGVEFFATCVPIAFLWCLLWLLERVLPKGKGRFLP